MSKGVSGRELHEWSDDLRARSLLLGVPLSCTACRHFSLTSELGSRDKFLLGAPLPRATQTAMADYNHRRPPNIVMGCAHSLHCYEVKANTSTNGTVGNPFFKTLRASKCDDFTATAGFMGATVSQRRGR